MTDEEKIDAVTFKLFGFVSGQRVRVRLRGEDQWEIGTFVRPDFAPTSRYRVDLDRGPTWYVLPQDIEPL